MAFVAAVVGEHSLWMVADRRLSAARRAPQDDATKIFALEATDGVALFGYAGLGATARRSQPAQWISNVLRGRSLDIESAMVAIADAASRQFPRHLAGLPLHGAVTHTVLVPTFVNGEPRLYTIHTTQPRDGSPSETAIDRQFLAHHSVPSAFCPFFSAIGSGASCRPKGRSWWRPFISLMRTCDRGRVRPHAVATRLAELAYSIHLEAPNAWVSPNCIVAWRFNPKSSVKWRSGHAMFAAGQAEPATSGLPTVTQGRDLPALVGAILPHVVDAIVRMRAGEQGVQMDHDAMNAELRKLPGAPDEALK